MTSNNSVFTAIRIQFDPVVNLLAAAVKPPGNITTRPPARDHLPLSLMAYNFVGRLKTLRGELTKLYVRLGPTKRPLPLRFQRNSGPSPRCPRREDQFQEPLPTH